MNNFPKLLHLTCKDKTNITNKLWIQCIQEYKKFYPDYTICLYDNNDIYKIIQEHYPQFYDKIKLIQVGAVLADIFRYLILYLKGGVYSDMDCFPIKNINDIFNEKNKNNINYINEQTTIIVGWEYVRKQICQWFIMAQPKQQQLLDCFLQTTKNLDTLITAHEHKHDTRLFSDIVMKNCGPEMFTKILKNNIKNITVLPPDFFCVGSIIKGKRKVKKSKQSYVIHHFDGSWR